MCALPISLLVFDYLTVGGVAGEPWRQRKELLAQSFPEHDYREAPLPEALYGVPGILGKGGQYERSPIHRTPGPE